MHENLNSKSPPKVWACSKFHSLFVTTNLKFPVFLFAGRNCGEGQTPACWGDLYADSQQVRRDVRPWGEGLCVHHGRHLFQRGDQDHGETDSTGAGLQLWEPSLPPLPTKIFQGRRSELDYGVVCPPPLNPIPLDCRVVPLIMKWRGGLISGDHLD